VQGRCSGFDGGCAWLLPPLSDDGIADSPNRGVTQQDEYDTCSNVPKRTKKRSTVKTAIRRKFPGIDLDLPEPESDSPTKLRQRPLVLVIDDDADVGEFLTSRLRKCGVDTAFASDGRQGYRIAAREKPSVIVSDYFMPHANIDFLLWKLRSTPATEKIPVFAMTGYDLDAIEAG